MKFFDWKGYDKTIPRGINGNTIDFDQVAGANSKKELINYLERKGVKVVSVKQISQKRFLSYWDVEYRESVLEAVKKDLRVGKHYTSRLPKD